MLGTDTIIKMIVVSVAISVGYGVKIMWPGAKKDAPIEQFAEEIIKEETGIDIDFSADDKSS